MKPDIDVTNWEQYGEEHLGTKPKMWLVEPRSEVLWLFKEATWNTLAGERYLKGDHWVEVAVAIVGRLLGVPTAECQLAHHSLEGHRVDGVLVRTVLDAGETLRHGNELLAEVGVSVRQKDRTAYSLDVIRRALEGVDPPRGLENLSSGWDAFCGYLVLDAICGNTDRHEENWGALEATGLRLAPSYDHASSLGFLLHDSERRQRLDTADEGYSIRHWVARAATPFVGRPHPCEAADLALRLTDKATREFWIESVSSLPDVADLLASIPENRASPTAREFATSVVAFN